MAKPSLFFEKLPAEMRNTIYELAFTPASSKGPVDLTNATPPSKAALMTCRQMYSEASGLYRRAYREYWSDSDFALAATQLNSPAPPAPPASPNGTSSSSSHSRLPAHIYGGLVPWGTLEINHISRLTLNLWDEEKDRIDLTLKMTDKRGGWENSVGDEIEDYLWTGGWHWEHSFHYEVDNHLPEEAMNACCVEATSEGGEFTVITVSEQLRALLVYYMCSAVPRGP